MQEEYVDVIIVGAGLSGIGAACHLQRECPERSYAILESRTAIGGTWDLFRYPGIRSDSDMHTLGYNFKPWREAKAIADGPSIRAYVNEAAVEHDINQHIRFDARVVAANWSSTAARWTVTVERSDGAVSEMQCNFLSLCSGYYNYEEGYTPEFTGFSDYTGTIVHPQHWPEELDCAGKNVLVIGSGATAMTLVPALAEQGAAVTMVQRSPTYVVSRPEQDRIANALRRVLPEKWAYAITRWKNVTLGKMLYQRTRTQPAKVKAMLLKMVGEELGPEFDVERHFTPSYAPWDQRLCLVPNGDLFKALKSGKAKVVTEHIERFTPDGLRLTNGEELRADVIVTATGLNLAVVGGIEVSVDGAAVAFEDTFSYKGMMFSGVPNLVQTFGYINASWTLRADLTALYVCRLLNHMRATSQQQCTPVLDDAAANMPAKPWIDDFSAGYMQRMMHLLPKQGDRDPWRNTQNYALDKKLMLSSPIADGVLRFGPQPVQPQQADAALTNVSAG